ncbi:MAG: DUF3160 domain-containing protein [Ignavibacteriales bacterium]|nr:DUF3160 domain-containing protein [Ignavibacteriales bacterium]
MKHVKFLLILAFAFSSNLFSQFSTEAYKQFLTDNQNLTSPQLMEMYSAGLFISRVNESYNNAAYFDSVKIKYELTQDEISLINKNGFVVTERLQQGSFGHQFEDIYHKDLPVYISSDAILHAFHSSYDKILKNTELDILISHVTTLLENIRNEFSNLVPLYSDKPELETMLKDLDVYISVARRLMDMSPLPYYQDNRDAITDLINYVNSEEFEEIPLFSSTPRKIDFSQFKPRGHYDDSNYPQLARYFRTMMWFGKIELYLIAPVEDDVKVPIEDEQRQIIISSLLSKLIEISNSREIFDEIEFIIKTFVGDQDNTTLPDLEEVLNESGITNVDLLLDTNVVKQFQEVLKTKSFAGQKILSQILIHDPMSPDKIEPASAFMPFGQRFVIDSYVTGSVVYDKVETKRMLPLTLDILFALGNDAAAQLLKDELDTYSYSPNLAALRYLIDSYDDEFWKHSIYNLWLNSIKSLNPPEERENLPSFMQTAAWWQQKMNSQLASWTELRHDNLLYAKQSYTGGATCSYPYSYVEPVPQFFSTIKVLAENTLAKLNNISSFSNYTKNSFNNYFELLEGVADTLGIIAQKELDNIELNENEKYFLQQMLYDNPHMGCAGPEHVGWYPNLFYEDWEQDDFHKEDFLVADYHTAPTDAGGYLIGWVKHAGTGPIDLAVIVAKNSANEYISYVGPVASYYEYTSTNFYRLTDDEWKENYLVKESSRPNWVNIYLANNDGNIKGEGLHLLTDIENPNNEFIIPKEIIIAQNYPNPFNPSTVIRFTIPQNLSNSPTKLTIYNIQGEVVKELLNEKLQAGTYLTKWNGDNQFGKMVSSGIYFYKIKVGEHTVVGKMNLVK